MKTYMLLIFSGISFFFSSCGSGGNAPAEMIRNNVISLTDAYLNQHSVLLSELTDSISFIVLETRGDLLSSSNPQITFSKDYIFSASTFFDWNGRRLGVIGLRGRGPLEELWGIYKPVHHSDGYFYSKGDKLIQYDLTGKATGKVKDLRDTESMGGRGRWGNSVAFASVERNFLIYCYPDSVYFINPDFDLIISRCVVETDAVNVRFNNFADRFTSYYNDTTLFYNFINDTIFHAYDTRLEPKWVVDFSEDLRPDKDFFMEHVRLLERVTLSGSIENSELVQRSKGKQIVTAAYETDEYVFLPMKELAFFMDPKPAPYQAYFIKETGETVCVKGAGFTDDILGMDYFFPKWGVFEDKMISSIWPYELLDFIREKRKKGESVNPRLENLAKTVKADDNPILIVAHLKERS